MNRARFTKWLPGQMRSFAWNKLGLRGSRLRWIAGVLVATMVPLFGLVCGLEAWFRARATRVVAARLADAGFLVQSDPELLIRYTTRGRRLVPGAQVRILHHRLSGLDIDMQINSLGFRDRELSPQKCSGEFRALVLGDSITWGDYLPADAVYVEKAEHLLNLPLNPPFHPSQEGNLQPVLQTKLPSSEGQGVGSWGQGAIKVRGSLSPSGRRVEMINAGVGDVGIREEIQILEESGLATQPDLVVLGFYMNDSRPPWGFAGEIRRPGWLRRHSALAAEAYRAFHLERWIKEQGEERFVWIYGLGEGHWRKNPAAFDRLAWMARYDWGAAWQPESWAKVDSELSRLRRLSARHGFQVLVVAFPVRFQIETEFLDDRPQKELARRARENGFGFLDLLPMLRSHRGETIYFDHCHPVAAANAWIGEALAQRIRSDYLATDTGAPR